MSILLATTLSAWVMHASSHLDTPVYCIDEANALRTHAGDVVTNQFHNCIETNWSSSLGAAVPSCHEEVAVEPTKPVAVPAAPATPAPATLNQEMLSVYFAFDREDLTVAAQEKLDKVVELLQKDTAVSGVDIVGYTDYLGNDTYNHALSQRRAQAVRSYIESRGYLKTRNVAVMALGAQQSVAECSHLAREDAKECLWRDRRVEIKLNYDH